MDELISLLLVTFSSSTTKELFQAAQKSIIPSPVVKDSLFNICYIHEIAPKAIALFLHQVLFSSSSTFNYHIFH
jgi:hypothetical protein